MEEQVDVIVVGGGQAGLAAGHTAQNEGLTYVILEAGPAVGGSWEARYDSLALFTPRAYSGLPGLPLPGDQSGYPSRDEIVSYLRQYAGHFTLKVLLNQPVVSATHDGDTFTIATPSRSFVARHLIVATGPFQTPRIPAWSAPIEGVVQMHSADYRNPSQIRGPRILVVGGGNSGAQIAEELAATFRVDVSVKAPMRFMPAALLGRSVFWWLDKTGALTAPTGGVRARLLRRRGDPIIGTTLPELIKEGTVRIRPEAQGIRDGAVMFADGSAYRYDSIVYSTGFTTDLSWLRISGALGEDGRPVQRAGHSERVSGLHYLGLGWMRSRNSAPLGGAGADAGYVIDHIAAHKGSVHGAPDAAREQPAGTL